MRMFFAAGLALGCIGFVSCGVAFQVKNGSEVKDVKDISSIEDDGNGKFNVVCKDGRREQSVTDEAIKRGDVCKPVPTPTPTLTPTPVVMQINPRAFNALYIWRYWQKWRLVSEILDYPEFYDQTSGFEFPDGVFYEQREEYWNKFFIGVPTAGAKVVNDVLEYPVQDGKQLKLKFSKTSEKEMNHPDAVTFCKDQGIRLPTVRELFDFCAAGVTEPNYGPNFEPGRYPSTARCGRILTWSASVNSYVRVAAWQFDGYSGDVYSDNRITPVYPGRVRCVGGE